jgi:aspartate racemase
LGLTELTPEQGRPRPPARIIFEELCQGVDPAESKAQVSGHDRPSGPRGRRRTGLIFAAPRSASVARIPPRMPLPTVDTAVAHAEAAVDFALS